MNTLTLIGGIGIGFTISSCLFFYVIGSTAKGSSKQQKLNNEHQDKTVELLSSRNAIDSKIEKHLSVLAEWAQQHWEQ